jgi:hypothetical protein
LIAKKESLQDIAGWSDEIQFAFFAIISSGYCTHSFNGYHGFSEKLLRVHIPLKNTEHLTVCFDNGFVDNCTEAMLFDETERHFISNDPKNDNIDDPDDPPAGAVLLMVYVQRPNHLGCASKPSRVLQDDMKKLLFSQIHEKWKMRLSNSPMPQHLFVSFTHFLSIKKIQEILELVQHTRRCKGLRTSEPSPNKPLFKYEYLHHPKLDILLSEWEDLVTHVFGVKKLYPHRAECRVYSAGSELPFHYDAHPHDFSVTINLAPQENTDMIFLIVPDRENYHERKTHSFNLQPGDALFFHGVSVKHGRPVFTGGDHVQLLLHYSYCNDFKIESTYYYDVLRTCNI